MKRFTVKMVTCMFLGLFLGTCLIFAGSVNAAETIKIGAIYPLTGSAAREGQESKNTVDLAVDIINNETDLEGIPLAKTAGLPNLGGAKIEVVYGDHQAKPEIGRAETERLITVENVIAMLGSYHSSVTLVATPVSDRYGIPFLVPDSTNPDITKKGFKTVFRTTPINDVYVRDGVATLNELQKKHGTNYKKVAISVDTSMQGKMFGDEMEKQLREHGYEIVGRVGTKQGATDVTADVLKLKSWNPEILFVHHYVAEGILFQKAYKKYQLEPKMVLCVGNTYGLPDFLIGAGKEANYVFVPGTFPAKFIGTQPATATVNEMFKKKYGRDMGDARAAMGLIVLADAINRAGSTDSEAIIKALAETDLNETQMLMPWKGVRFGPTGENTLASITYQQILDGQYEIVWPFRLATTDAVYPAPAWKDRD